MKTLNRALLAAGAAACAVVPAFGPALNAQADTLSQPLALEDVRHALTRTSFAAAPADLQAYIGQPRAVLGTRHAGDRRGAQPLAIMNWSMRSPRLDRYPGIGALLPK